MTVLHKTFFTDVPKQSLFLIARRTHWLCLGCCPCEGGNQNSCLEVRVAVRNYSSRRGRETLLLYYQPPEPGANGAPLKQLVAFDKVDLMANTETELGFTLDIYKHLTTVQADGTRVLISGVHSLLVVDQQLTITISKA